MLIDTHVHLDATEFAADRAQVIARARAAGVDGFVIPAVAPENFGAVQALARNTAGAGYALGIHPLHVRTAGPEALRALAWALEAARDDPRLVAIGEIGLDFLVPELQTPLLRERQEWLYSQQLDLALEFGLPVLLHGRRAHDLLLKHLRRRGPIGGIAHAFNGSAQQARQFLQQGFALGYGGASTFDRARRIRRLAAELPADALVLETDAPDMAPAWLHPGPAGRPARNEPGELARIAGVLAGLRAADPRALIEATGRNAQRVLPRLAACLALH